VTARIRVVVVEDSLVQRAHLVSVLEADHDIQVVGQAASVVEALDRVELTRPDVITVDLHIPEGGGQLLIEQIMARTPTPILVLSATVQDDRSSTAVDALAGGALVALPKPARWQPSDEAELRRTVRNLNRVPVIHHPRASLRSTAPRLDNGGPRRSIVAIAASAGGPAALATVLANLSGLTAPVLVVQHLHPDFTDGFAAWMNRVSALPVVVAQADQTVRPGHVYIAPGGLHMRLGPGLRVQLSTTPDTVHKPSADELFSSVAEHAGADAAKGLLAISRSGGRTLGQVESSCAVFGMPRAAGELGAVDQFLDPEGIARAVRRLAKVAAP
jgi:two-component system chemotaxis response regulator CheB